MSEFHKYSPVQSFLVFFVNQVRKLLTRNSEYADMEKELEKVRVYVNLLVGYSSNIAVTA